MIWLHLVVKENGLLSWWWQLCSRPEEMRLAMFAWLDVAAALMLAWPEAAAAWMLV